MSRTYHPEFEGAYLEDIYFMGITAEGTDLRLKLLFALTTHHPEYAAPLPGEAHCYRHGALLVEEPVDLELVPARTMHICRDAQDTIDFGSLELSRSEDGRWHVHTEWFDLAFGCARLRLMLDEPKLGTA